MYAKYLDTDYINNKTVFQVKDWETNENLSIDIKEKSIIKIFGARK